MITGISNKLYRSEDYLFEGYEKLNGFIIKNDIDIDIEDKNDSGDGNYE